MLFICIGYSPIISDPFFEFSARTNIYENLKQCWKENSGKNVNLWKLKTVCWKENLNIFSISFNLLTHDADENDPDYKDFYFNTQSVLSYLLFNPFPHIDASDASAADSYLKT